MKTRSVLFLSVAVCAAVFVGSPNTAYAAKYTATAWLLTRSREPAIQSRAEREYSDKEFQTFKKTQCLLVKSPFVLRAALRKPQASKLQSVRDQTEKGDPVRWLKGIVNVGFPDDAEIMLISCTRDDPAEAQVLAKSLVEAYLEELVDENRDARRQRVTEMESIAARMERDLRTKKSELRNLGVPASADERRPASTKPRSVDLEMIQANIEVSERLLAELSADMERARIELHAPLRVVLVAQAELPVAPD